MYTMQLPRPKQITIKDIYQEYWTVNSIIGKTIYTANALKRIFVSIL